MLLNLVIALIIIPLAANYIADWSNIMNELKYWLFYKVYTKQTQYRDFRLKPLDCPGCFSFHTVWIWELFNGQSFSFETIIFPFAAAGIATLINKL